MMPLLPSIQIFHSDTHQVSKQHHLYDMKIVCYNKNKSKFKDLLKFRILTCTDVICASVQ